MLTRRNFFTGLGAAAIAAPFVVRESGVLMPVRDRRVVQCFENFFPKEQVFRAPFSMTATEILHRQRVHMALYDEANLARLLHEGPWMKLLNEAVEKLQIKKGVALNPLRG